MHKYTEEQFARIAAGNKVSNELLAKAYATALNFYTEDGPPAQAIVTPQGSIELVYHADGTEVSVLFELETDPDDPKLGDFIYADSETDVLFMGPLDDPDTVRKTKAFLRKMSSSTPIESVDVSNQTGEGEHGSEKS